MSSNLIIYIIIIEALLPHILLDCIFPSPPGQPSLTHSLYPHISHHYNISLTVSSADMIIPLNSAPPHAHSYPFHIGLFPYFALILHMAYPVCAINVAQRLHLDWKDHILWSLSLSPDLASVHRCWLYCAFATSTPHRPTWNTIVPGQTWSPGFLKQPRQFSNLSSIIPLAASQMSRLSASSIAHGVSFCISLLLCKSMINRNRTECSASVSLLLYYTIPL